MLGYYAKNTHLSANKRKNTPCSCAKPASRLFWRITCNCMKISKVHYLIRFAGSPADLANLIPPVCACRRVFFSKPANWRTGEVTNRPADHLNCIHAHPRMCAYVFKKRGGQPVWWSLSFSKKVRIGSVKQITV